MQQYSSARSGEYFQIELYGNQEPHILKDDSDFNYFLNLLNKYLLDNETVDLLAYCLNGGSIHMLLYQFSDGEIDLLLKNICLDSTILGLTHLRDKINYGKECGLKSRFRQLTV